MPWTLNTYSCAAGCRTRIYFCVSSESARPTQRKRPGLRTALAWAIGATKALAFRASHDVDGDCRHAAFHRSWLGDWDFLWLHPAVSAQDVVVDCGSVGLPLQ